MCLRPGSISITWPGWQILGLLSDTLNEKCRRVFQTHTKWFGHSLWFEKDGRNLIFQHRFINVIELNFYHCYLSNHLVSWFDIQVHVSWGICINQKIWDITPILLPNSWGKPIIQVGRDVLRRLITWLSFNSHLLALLKSCSFLIYLLLVNLSQKDEWVKREVEEKEKRKE